jgi:hypothetical protein
MRQALAALVAGLLFGLGLTVSQMANPAKVLGFLDLAGDWDPSLAFVLAGAVATAAVGFRLVQRAGRPLLAPAFRLPTATRIDRPLLLGAALFGLGWGLVGFCPGPALAALGLDGLPVPVFVLAMLAGMLLHRPRESGRTPGQAATPARSA